MSNSDPTPQAGSRFNLAFHVAFFRLEVIRAPSKKLDGEAPLITDPPLTNCATLSKQIYIKNNLRRRKQF